MDQDIKKIKPYINNVKKQLIALQPHLEKLTKKPIDEQLLEENSEREKLNISNTFAYILNSLFFSYGKIVGISNDDMKSIRQELEKVQDYMKKTNDFDININKLNDKKLKLQENVKQNIEKSLNGNKNITPAISKKNFQGKHTKFDNNNNKNYHSDDEQNLKHKEEKDEEANSTEYNSNLVNEIIERTKESKAKKIINSNKNKKKVHKNNKRVNKK